MYLLEQNGYNVIGGFYLQDCKKQDADEKKKQNPCEDENMIMQMAKGYEEMSDINLALAEDAFETDNQLWSDILD